MPTQVRKKRIAILISGRGSNMKAILDNVESGRLRDLCDVVLVFSNQYKAKGLKTAKEYGIETKCIESKGKKRKEFDKKLVDLLKPYDLDYIILAGFMRILSGVMIEAYENRIINIHPADTYLYKGAHAYEWAYENKMKKTKITVHLVDEGVDTGRILGQKDVDIKHCQSLEEIQNTGLKIEHEFYSEILEKIFTGEIEIQY
jgi:phosphoribosylglycinamide formyltransferase 1